MLSDSRRVTDFFDAASRDWAPASARRAASVLFAPFSPDSEVSRHCASVLSEAEQQRASRFVTKDGGAHFEQRRAFRRYCGACALGSPQALSRIAFRETEKGRPYLPHRPDVWFAFSACRFGFLGAWSSTNAIGVDLEDRTRNLEAVELARRYFSEAEAEAVESADGPARRRAFCQLWTLKEAALKSIGEGLPFGLDAFTFELTPAPGLVHAPHDYGGPERFEAHVMEEADICAALVIREGHSRL